MNNKDFDLNIDVEDLKKSIRKIDLLRSSIKKVLVHYDLDKEDIMEICNINQSQYYRRLNGNPPFSDTELLMILDALLDKMK
ncbi:MAG: hypothetical protein RLO12_03640 [Fulvivirga sp.]